MTNNTATRARRVVASGLGLLLAGAVLAAPSGASATISVSPRATVTPHELSGLLVPDSAYPIPAGAVYVNAASGSDTNPGGPARPLATVKRAIAIAKAGGTIVLRAGTYREALGAIGKKLTFQAYPHEQVWWSGSVVVSDWAPDLVNRPDGTLWVHTGWTTQFCQTCYDKQAIDPAYPNAGLPDMVFRNGRPLVQVTRIADVAPGRFYVDYANQALYVGDDPLLPGTTIEASNKTYAIQFNAGASGSALLGIGVEHYAPNWNFSPLPAMVIVNNATNVRFDRDAFAYSASRGLTLYGAGGSVTNSWIVNNGYTGLHGNKADNVDVEHNFVAGNNYERFWAGFSPAASASGVKFTASANAMIRDNIFQDNHANGVWFDVSSYNPTIVNNLAQRNERNGIYVEITGYGIVASNLAVANGQGGIKLSGATYVRVYNNTAADNLTYQLSVHDDGRNNTNQQLIDKGITWNTAHNELYNNILVAPNAGSIGSLLFTEDLDKPKIVDAGTMITAMDGNVYGRAKAKNPGAVAVWTRVAPAPLSRYLTLAQLQAGTGYDAASLEYSGYATSPIFNDPAHGDYSLLAASAARASGAPLPADVAAAIGVAPSTTPDRGALIYPTIPTAPATP